MLSSIYPMLHDVYLLMFFGRDKGACAPIRVRAQCALKPGAP